MSEDVDIIRQIEKKLGIELKRLPLKKILGTKNGFAVDTTGHVKGLKLDGRRIKDISFLRSSGGLTLTHLSLMANQITDLTPLSALTKLENLYLSGNQITDLTPLSALTKLEKFYLSRNQITDLTPLSAL